jgi:hypothetical protein
VTSLQDQLIGPAFADFFVASKAMTFNLYGNVLTRCRLAMRHAPWLAPVFRMHRS